MQVSVWLHNSLFILHSLRCEPNSLDADYQWRIYTCKVFLEGLWGSGVTAPLVSSLCSAWGEWSTVQLSRRTVGKGLPVRIQ
jgi:hypothetical protein